MSLPLQASSDPYARNLDKLSHTRRAPFRQCEQIPIPWQRNARILWDGHREIIIICIIWCQGDTSLIRVDRMSGAADPDDREARDGRTRGGDSQGTTYSDFGGAKSIDGGSGCS